MTVPAADQKWRRKDNGAQVVIKDRLLHLGTWWVSLTGYGPTGRRSSWWMKETSFEKKYIHD